MLEFVWRHDLQDACKVSCLIVHELDESGDVVARLCRCHTHQASTQLLCHTDQVGELQLVFSSLVPHIPSIRMLTGSCGSFGEKSLQQMLARWKTFWLCLPRLQHIVWTIPSCGGMPHGDDSFGLPSQTRGLKLYIGWDQQGKGAMVHLGELEMSRYHWKVTDLIIRDAHIDSPGSIRFGDQQWPQLTLFKCICNGIYGNLEAPNLRVIVLEIGDGILDWQSFESCHNLQTVRVTSEDSNGFLCCINCSFPYTLQHLYLKVGKLLENGCFTQDLSSLHTMHVSCNTDADEKVDLRAVTSHTRSVDVSVDRGRLALWMPPQHDEIWGGLC